MCQGDMMYWHTLGTWFSFNSTNVLLKALAYVTCVQFLQVTYLSVTTYSLTSEQSCRALTQDKVAYNIYVEYCILLYGHLSLSEYPLAVPKWEVSVIYPSVKLSQATDLWAFHLQIFKEPYPHIFGRHLDPTGSTLRHVDTFGQLDLTDQPWRLALTAEIYKAKNPVQDWRIPLLTVRNSCLPNHVWAQRVVLWGEAGRVPTGWMGGSLWDAALERVAKGRFPLEAFGGWDHRCLGCTSSNMRGCSLESFVFSWLTSFLGKKQHFLVFLKRQSTWERELFSSSASIVKPGRRPQNLYACVLVC